MKHILAILSLIPALAFGQASLGVNKTTGAINSPVSATTFRDANAVGSQADVVEPREGFDHVGLLVNGLPGTAGLPFI